MIAGYERPSQVRAMLEAFKRERQGTSDPRWLAAIDEQERIFKAELERMEREGDYQEPKRVVQQGAFAWIGEYGHPHVK